MKEPRTQKWILVAEDDDDDFVLIERALEHNGSPVGLRRVTDGDALLKALAGGPVTAAPAAAPLQPGTFIVLLDLNMPKKDGREALREIKTHPVLRRVPVVIFTTSSSDEDATSMYEMGVNSFIRKPTGFSSLASTLKVLCDYWFGTVTLPPQ